MGLFWTVIGSIQSDLELPQWRANMLELATVVSKHVFQTIDEGLVHLDCWRCVRIHNSTPTESCEGAIVEVGVATISISALQFS